jgi:hypothetical protein
MQLIKATLAVQLWTAAALAAFNTSQEFYLRTEVKPGQTGKESFNNLWVYGYHTGAGFNDAMVSANKSYARPGFLNASDIHKPDGTPLYGMEFDLGSQFPWSLQPDAAGNLYAAWREVFINAGGAPTNYSAFFLNQDGLQWTDSASGTNADGFGGWLSKFVSTLV